MDSRCRTTACSFGKNQVKVDTGVSAFFILGEHLLLGVRKDTVEASQQREGKNYLAVVGLLVVTP